MIEFSNTIYAHLQIMNNTNNYHFSSNSTGPLEHKFGYARVKSNDINTLSRFIKVISSIQKVQNEVEQIIMEFQFNQLKHQVK